MTQTPDSLTPFVAAREFIRREARILERRLFAALFEGASGEGVLDVLRGYRNADGGFGQGLAPDVLCPDSLPHGVELALLTMNDVSTVDHEMAARAADFLGTVSRRGAVAVLTPVFASYPHAAYLDESFCRPGVNPTAGLAGLMFALGVDHPWRAEATAFCWSELERGLPEDAHVLAEVLSFLEHVDDQERAAAVAERIADHLAGLPFLRIDPQDPEYGMTPLHLAPCPSSRWRALFSDEVIAGHLDRMVADQQPDGGWPPTWGSPSRASELAFRGIETIRAVRVLTAYGRMTPA